jgi:hypothetical protein
MKIFSKTFRTEFFGNMLQKVKKWNKSCEKILRKNCEKKVCEKKLRRWKEKRREGRKGVGTRHPCAGRSIDDTNNN